MPIVSQLGAEVTEVLKQPDVRTRIETMSASPWEATSAELTSLIEADSKRWGDLIRDNRIVVK